MVFFGTSAFGLPALDALLKSRHSLVHIITTPAKPQGRDLKTTASPVKEWADKNKIAVTETSTLKDEKSLQVISALKPDVLIVASFGLMLPKNILELPKKTALNIHPSLLPRYRGAAPIHWALYNGDAETGVCIIRMTEKLDAGDIVLKETSAISETDDFFSLEKALSRMGAKLLLEALDKLDENALSFTPQSASGASYARKLTKEDGRIDWKLSSKALHDRVRALVEWPGCFTFYQGKRVVISKTSLEKEIGRGKPGEVLLASPKTGLVVATGDGALRIEELQMEGRKKLSAREFLAGSAIKAGVLFE